MRTATSHIMDVWNGGGPFVGPDGKPHTRVTIQAPYTGDILHATKHVNTDRGLPVRWYQNKNNDQTQVEVPNVRNVTIDRSVDQPAASCRITIANQWMRDNGESQPGLETGEPGYFTSSRGRGMEARARWGHIPNEWQDAFVPNALIRTYQGYGGHGKTIAQAVADGNLMLTGVWLVDTVNVSAKGNIELDSRDMAKLLLEQQLYPPLVPGTKYPLKYFRWIYKTAQVRSKSITRTTTVSTAKPGVRRVTYSDSASDRWYGYNFNLHGHKPTDSLDGNASTYWISVGNSGPDRPFTTDWIQYNVNSDINAIKVHTWGGNYQMYVSVMVDGQWQGSRTVPYDYTPLIGTQPHVVNTNADIPYVGVYGTPWETSKIYTLPAMYHAQKVRISFRHHTRSPWGPWYYRCGVREFSAMVTSTGPKGGPVTHTYKPVHFFADAAKPSWVGYVAADGFDNVDAFGDAVRYPQTGGPANDLSNAYDGTLNVTQLPQGGGYWTATASGEIHSFGAAVDYGSPKRRGLSPNLSIGSWGSLATTQTGLGYWAISHLGAVEAFGDAIDGDLPRLSISSYHFYRSCDSHVDHPGFVVVRTDGRVYSVGGAPTFGNWSGTTRKGVNAVVAIAYNKEGTGYWLMNERGEVQAFGDCDDHGGGIASPSASTDWQLKYWALVPQEDGGYILLRGDGQMYPIGTEYFFGGPVPGGTAVLRRDGNYKDYSDIIKDLALWAGFLLYDPDITERQPPTVYGNIESTGSYAKEPLPDDIFDKRPVIDAMTELKEAVGYLLWVDEEGALRFQSPNWWAPGNFNEQGTRLNNIPEIDERLNLTDYRAVESDDVLRSYIIIASEDPDEASDSTISTKIFPPSAKRLRGLIKPAMWVNGWFQDKAEQELMAELIALHIHFQSRLGQITCVANPAIQIDDQVRIIERVTNESLIHYVRGISTTHDLQSGEYTMTLTTHQLGTNEGWLIGDGGEEDYTLSDSVLQWLKDSPSRSASSFVAAMPTNVTAYSTGSPSNEDGAGT